MNAAYASERETAEWLASRQAGIGSSDAAAVCGLDPYKTPLEVYVAKTDGHEPTGELAEDPAMRWGLLLEPSIARGYELETGRTLDKPPPATHRQYPWMLATPDYACPGRLVELKTASSHSLGWTEEAPPERVVVQCQHQMAVTGIELCDVAVLIDGRHFQIYELRRDEAVIEDLIRIELAFWARVERREPPEPDWAHASTPELISKIYKPFVGKEVSLPDHCLAMVQDYIDFGNVIKDAESKREFAKANLIHAMQDAQRGHVSGYTITRKECQRKAYEVKATSYTSFTVKAPKSIAPHLTGELSNV